MILRAAALLLLFLGAAVATVPGRPTVMDIRSGWTRSRRARGVRTASSDVQPFYTAYEEKEVCLQQVAARDCGDTWTGKVDGGAWDDLLELLEFFQDEFWGGGAFPTSPDFWNFPGDCGFDEACADDLAVDLGSILLFITAYADTLAAIGQGSTDLINSVWTSEFACCNKHNKYGPTSGSTVGGFVHSSANRAGSCDWTINWVNLGFFPEFSPVPDNPDLNDIIDNGGVPINSRFKKLGTASALCYFGADSDCGGPLCERTVLQLDGQVYDVAEAYSYWGADNTGCAVPQVPDFRAPGFQPRLPASNSTLGAPGKLLTRERAEEVLKHLQESRRATNGTDTHHKLALVLEKLLQKLIEKDARSDVTAPRAGHRSNNLRAPRPAPAARHSESAAAAAEEPEAMASTQNDGARDDSDQTVLVGRATVINGIVSSMAGPTREKWDSGVFEHVLDFGRDGVRTHTGAVDPNVPWVRDKSTKLTFYRRGEEAY